MARHLSVEYDRRPSLNRPVSQLCTRSQFDEASYAFWCKAIREEPRLHRKQWEFCYILQGLSVAGMLSPGFRGLGFGVGEEPLMAVMADYGATVVGTDLDPELAHAAGWTQDRGYSANINSWNNRGICDAKVFADAVQLRRVDMNDIPDDLVEFDFCWSSCAFEHLGTIDLGLEFVENSLKTLRPGGVAVHTTEYNVGEAEKTIEAGVTVLYREKDLMALAERVHAAGHEIALNFHSGDLPDDDHIDLPPYSVSPHLKLEFDGYVTTSAGLIIRKGV